MQKQLPQIDAFPPPWPAALGEKSRKFNERVVRWNQIMEELPAREKDISENPLQFKNPDKLLSAVSDLEKAAIQLQMDAVGIQEARTAILLEAREIQTKRLLEIANAVDVRRNEIEEILAGQDLKASPENFRSDKKTQALWAEKAIIEQNCGIQFAGDMQPVFAAKKAISQIVSRRLVTVFGEAE